MTKETLTTDEIKGLVKLVKDWKVDLWTIKGEIEDVLRVAITPLDRLFPYDKYEIVTGKPDNFNALNHGILPVLGTCSIKDDKIDDLYRGVINKHEAEYESQHNQAVENARRILRKQQ